MDQLKEITRDAVFQSMNDEEIINFGETVNDIQNTIATEQPTMYADLLNITKSIGHTKPKTPEEALNNIIKQMNIPAQNMKALVSDEQMKDLSKLNEVGKLISKMSEQQ